jgi:hypothetical protein
MIIILLNMLCIIKLDGADENGEIWMATNVPQGSTPLRFYS